VPFNDQCNFIDTTTVKVNRYKVSVVADLVFVANLGVNHIVQDQFSEHILASLGQTLAGHDSEVLISSFNRKFNWKLILENLRDPLHPYFVHKKSLMQRIDIDLAYLEAQVEPPPSLAPLSLLEASIINSSYHTHELKSNNVLNHASHVEPSTGEEAYLNWLLFPNTHIASADSGRTILIESYNPIDPNTCMITLFIFTRKRLKRLPRTYLQEVFRHAFQILDEDFSVVESVQSTLAETLYEEPHYGTADQHLSDFLAGIAYSISDSK
jgi:phenylpropionate dioxygenase-like ring-hydroxylating dioxygenase large terminal subunit